MMPVPVLPGVGGKVPVAILFVLGVLAVAALANTTRTPPKQPQF
ncbi:MAG: hypothetical protein Q7J38_13665 [Gallionella sp.]|nr:hypothetical protein [Gallionella sp.]